MASRDVLKVSALHYKHPSKTDEEFEQYVTENINPACVKLVKRHEVMKYSIVSGPRFQACLVCPPEASTWLTLDDPWHQTFCPSSVSEALAATVEKVRPDWTFISSHAVLTCWVRDIQHLMTLSNDSEYQEIGQDSEDCGIDSNRGDIMVGYEKVYIDNKEIV